MTTTPGYRVVLVNPLTGRRKPLRCIHSNFYRAADMCRHYERRAAEAGRPVRAEIVTVAAEQAGQQVSA